MENPLATFTPSDVAELKKKAKHELACKQAESILEWIHNYIKNNPDAKYTSLFDTYKLTQNLLCDQNLQHMYDNGFRIYRCSRSAQNKEVVYKYFICWDIQNFHDEVFKNEMAKNLPPFNFDFDYVELVPDSLGKSKDDSNNS